MKYETPIVKRKNFSRFKSYSANSAESKTIADKVEIKKIIEKMHSRQSAEILLADAPYIAYFTDLMASDYLKLFNYSNRTALEKLLIIYTCHTKYLAVAKSINLNDLMNRRFASLMKKHIRNKLANQVPITSDKLAKALPKVIADLQQVGYQPLDTQFYQLLLKEEK